MTDVLIDALNIQRAAAKLGFDWRELSELWDKLAEEIGELQQAVSQGPERMQDELGDLLFMVVNLARHLKIDPTQALIHANDKFTNRFKHVIDNFDNIPETGHPQRLEVMERFWQEAKCLERTQSRKK